ncbi:unnamed protein product [Cylicostephanus goldi]|uniref:Uncharacterized protein n=1 Tax=Cylicostephanus goldi TaxID=71465 RepID=A0A3P6SVS2_CYLGO|nr:unnamed protein product [Cylicostephanus goldi]
MRDDEIMQMLDHEGILSLNLKLQTCNDDKLERNEVEPDKPSKLLNEKTTVLQLKNKMREIIAARQRNPQLIARQKLIGDIEGTTRSYDGDLLLVHAIVPPGVACSATLSSPCGRYVAKLANAIVDFDTKWHLCGICGSTHDIALFAVNLQSNEKSAWVSYQKSRKVRE